MAGMQSYYSRNVPDVMSETIYGGDAPLPLFFLQKWPAVVDALKGLIGNIQKKDLVATNKSLLAFCKGELKKRLVGYPSSSSFPNPPCFSSPS